MYPKPKEDFSGKNPALSNENQRTNARDKPSSLPSSATAESTSGFLGMFGSF